MGVYQTAGDSFDIRETDNGQWAVILMPDLSAVSVGTGQPLAAFHTLDDAKKFCDEWRNEEE